MPGTPPYLPEYNGSIEAGNGALTGIDVEEFLNS